MAQPYCPFDLDTEPSQFGLREQLVTTDFGQLSVIHSGQRGGPEATLLLHGVGSSWTTWTPLLRAARERGHDLGDVVLVDLPGFGHSDNRLGHLESTRVAAALAGVVTALGFTRVRLVGHSMGGLLALDMAARPQLPVTSLHLAAGAAFAVIDAATHPLRGLLRTPGVAALFWSQYALGRLRGGSAAASRLNRRRLLTVLLWPLIAHPRRFRQSAADALAAELRPASFRLAAANIVGYDARRRWGALTIPVHAAFGARDRLVPAADRATLARVYPGARATEISDASHFLHIERPFETLDALAL